MHVVRMLPELQRILVEVSLTGHMLCQNRNVSISCCASDNTELAGVDDHRVSYFLSLCPQDVVFWNAGR